MPVFQYSAQDQNGASHQGTVEATDQNDAYAKIQASGLMPTAIQEVQQAAGEGDGKKKKHQARGFFEQALALLPPESPPSLLPF